MTQNRELGLESKQITFCSPVQLTLLGRRVASIPLGDVTGYGERGYDDGVRRALGFPPSTMPNDTEDFASQGDGLLPHFEITDASSHGAKMTARASGCGIELARLVSKPLLDTINRA